MPARNECIKRHVYHEKNHQALEVASLDASVTSGGSPEVGTVLGSARPVPVPGVLPGRGASSAVGLCGAPGLNVTFMTLKDQIRLRNERAAQPQSMGTTSSSILHPPSSARVKASLAAEKRLADAAVKHWERAGLPAVVTQFKFHPERQWRFDFAFGVYPHAMPESTPMPPSIAIEVQGGNFMKSGAGAHGRGAALRKEYEKWRAAAELGWRILPVLPEELLTPRFTAQLKRILTTDGHR